MGGELLKNKIITAWFSVINKLLNLITAWFSGKQTFKFNYRLI